MTIGFVKDKGFYKFGKDSRTLATEIDVCPERNQIELDGMRIRIGDIDNLVTVLRAIQASQRK